MEGIGSRLGRASSRYGPAATVFNGPVRKWKKKWVLASSSSSSSGVAYQSSSQPQSNAQKLLLCRWTPIPPPSSSDADGAAAPPDEPPRRKFRYTPIAVLEEQKNAELRSGKDEVRKKEMDRSATVAKMATVGNDSQGELNVNEVFKEETQESRKILNSPRANKLDLALCLNGQNQSQDSAGNDDLQKSNGSLKQKISQSQSQAKSESESNTAFFNAMAKTLTKTPEERTLKIRL